MKTCPVCKRKYIPLEVALYKGQKFRLRGHNICISCNVKFHKMLLLKINNFPDGLQVEEVAVKEIEEKNHNKRDFPLYRTPKKRRHERTEK